METCARGTGSRIIATGTRIGVNDRIIVIFDSLGVVRMNRITFISMNVFLIDSFLHGDDGVVILLCCFVHRFCDATTPTPFHLTLGSISKMCTVQMGTPARQRDTRYALIPVPKLLLHQQRNNNQQPTSKSGMLLL